MRIGDGLGVIVFSEKIENWVWSWEVGRWKDGLSKDVKCRTELLYKLRQVKIVYEKER